MVRGFGTIPPPPPGPVELDEYVVTRDVVGDSVMVEARLLYDWGDGRKKPSLNCWVGPHPSVVYVSEPNILMHWLGDTLEKRLARAERSVSCWAEREIEKRRRLKRAASAKS